VLHTFGASGGDGAYYVFVAGLTCYAGQALTGQVYKFAHGGQTPITMLAEKYVAIGCAVDPDTGDLAASNAYSSVSGDGSVAVFEKASGKPTTPNYIYRVTVAASRRSLERRRSTGYFTDRRAAIFGLTAHM